MATCTLCGNEEIEKPHIVVRVIRLGGGRLDTIEIPFGSYCWRKNRKGCVVKANEIQKAEISARGLDRYN